MKAREYAISRGLAKEGRGKLSFAAHAAIKQAIADGMEFEDYKDGKVVKNDSNSSGASTHKSRVSRNSGNENASGSGGESGIEGPTAIKSRPVTHEYSTIYGIDIRGRSPIVIAFQYCSVCIVQVRYCSHEIPQLPAWIGGGDGLINQPTTELAQVIMAERMAESWASETI